MDIDELYYGSVCYKHGWNTIYGQDSKNNTWYDIDNDVNLYKKTLKTTGSFTCQ